MNNEWWVDQFIRELAYYKWQNAGCPKEGELEFWLEAEKEILASVDKVFEELGNDSQNT